MNITERIKGILLRPKEEWQTIAGETTPIAELYKNGSSGFSVGHFRHL